MSTDEFRILGRRPGNEEPTTGGLSHAGSMSLESAVVGAGAVGTSSCSAIEA